MSTDQRIAPFPPHSGVANATLGVFALASITNLAFLLAPVLGVRLGFTTSFVSEFGARGEPGASFYHRADNLNGLLLLIGIALIWRVVPANVLTRIALICLVFTGIFTITDGFSPLDCTPTADAMCRLEEARREVSFSHQVHNFTGIGEAATIGFALVFLGFGLWRDAMWGRWARWFMGLGIFFSLANIMIIAQYIYGVPWLGVTQRSGIATFALFLLIIGIAGYDAWQRHD